MRAELSTSVGKRSVEHIPLDGGSVELQIIPLTGYLHLRSAGRASETEELTRLARDLLDADLGAVNAFVPLLERQIDGACFAMRTRPSEILLFTVSETGHLDSKTRALFENCKAATSTSPLLHAVDASHGYTAFRLTGKQAKHLLLRLGEAASFPQAIGRATRLRLAEMHVTLIWRSENTYLLLVDALYADFLAARLTYAAGALDSSL